MASSTQTARAINDLLQLSEQDEQNLMEVIEDYFTVREDRDIDRDSDISSDEDNVGDGGKT